MSRRVVDLGVLAASLAATPALIQKLERAGLVVPLGRDERGQTWVDADARRQVERVMSLIGAGYAVRDITAVIGRIEPAAGPRRVAKVVGLDALASAAKVDVDALRRWVDDALIVPWAMTEDGQPLFTQAATAQARSFAALEVLGLGAERARWASVMASGATAKGARVEREALQAAVLARLEAVEGAARELKKALPKLALAGPKPRLRLLARGRPASSSAKRSKR